MILVSVFCLHDFARAGFIDVTFSSLRGCADFFGKCRSSPGDPGLKQIKINPLFNLDEVPLIIHVYKPFLGEEDIWTFLVCQEIVPAFLWQRRSRMASEPGRGRDGIWTVSSWIPPSRGP